MGEEMIAYPQPTKWDIRFLRLAEHISTWSKDPSTQVGAVIVDTKHRLVSIGYNGFARRVLDDPRLHYRETKYEMIVHGDINAIISANRSVEGCTMYTWPMMPCSRCAAVIINAGISRVATIDRFNERMHNDLTIVQFNEAGVHLDVFTELGITDPI